MVPVALESDLRKLTDEIRRLEGEADQAEARADKLVADIRESGTEPLLDKDAFEKVDAAYKEADALREEASQLRQRRERVMNRAPRRSDNGHPSGTRSQDLVRALMESEEYRRLADLGAFTSGSTQPVGIEIPVGEVVSREATLQMVRGGFARGFRADTAVVDDMVAPDLRLVPPVETPVRQIRVTQLVNVTTTDSDMVTYVRQTTRTDAAAETAPGTAYSEASYVFEDVDAPVRDIGHWTPVHRRNLADEGQIRGVIEGQLANGVERRLEAQVVAGDGDGQNLTGILETDGIGSIVRDVSSPGESRLEAIHRGITAIRLGLFGEPDAIGIHPTDYEQVIFEKGTDGHYLLGPASQQTSRTVWGFPTAITTAFPAGTVLVGNFREGATLYLRAGVSLRASESHSTLFTERRVAILAELRAAFAVPLPEAFAAVSLDGSS